MNAVISRSPIWLHTKSGGLYEEIGQAKFAYGDGEFLPVMVYRSVDDGVVWVRDLGEFLDGRFTQTQFGHSQTLTKVLDGFFEADCGSVHIVPSGDGTIMVFRAGTI